MLTHNTSLIFNSQLCYGVSLFITIFAFLTAQNCELNAQRNLWCENLEF